MGFVSTRLPVIQDLHTVLSPTYRYLVLTKPPALPSVSVQCFGVLSDSYSYSVVLSGPDSVNRPKGVSVPGVHRGAWMEEGDQNGRNIKERGKACMDIQAGTLIVC